MLIKLGGIILIVLCSAMTGVWKASGLSNRVCTLENITRLYQYLHDRLKYLQPNIETLMQSAADSPEFEDLSFLKECVNAMQNGKSFPDSFSSSVLADEKSLGSDAAAIVANLGNVLGQSDLESQLAAIEYGKSLLEIRLEDARDYAAKHKKLYKTLGVLAGVGIATLIA